MDVQFIVTTECMSVTSAMRKNSHWVNAGIATILGGPATEAVEGLGLESVHTESLKSSLSASAECHIATENSFKNENTQANDEKPSEEPTKDSETEPTSANPESAEPIRRATQDSEAMLVLNFSTLRQLVAGKTNEEIDICAACKPFLEVIKSPLVSGQITSLALTSIEKFLNLGVISLKNGSASKCANQIVNAISSCRFEASDRTSDDVVMLKLMSLIQQVVQSHISSLLAVKSLLKLVETCITMCLHLKRSDMLRRAVITTLNSVVLVVFGNLDNKEFSKASNGILSMFTAAINPEQLRTTNTMRITVLNLLKTCLEIGNGKLNAQSPVFKMLWKYLAQLVRTNNHPQLVRETLLLISTIMKTIPEQFKLEFGFIILYLLTSLTPLSDLPRDEGSNDMFYAGIPNRPKGVKSAPVEPGSNILTIPTAALTKTPETREAMIEAFATLAAASPTIFTDLYINYDCDLGSLDLCEDLVGFLCRNAYPDSATWSTSSVPPLCLEAVLSGLNALVGFSKNSEVEDDISERLKLKTGKSIETQVAETFNQSTSKGIADMLSFNLILSDSPQDIANFLLRCKKLNKAVLGKYFAKSENKEVLGFYVKGFDFKGLRIDESLRIMLCSFRLPGESAQIENLLQKFADHYISYGDKVEDCSDSAFILAYAVLMLNTDHYSPTLKRRMDYDAFARNVKGVNKALPDEYVKAIFDGITSQEIIMPEEHDTDETFEHSWRENVLALQPTENYISNLRSANVTRAVFETSWKPLVSTLSFVFATATDDLVFKRVITGFQQLASLATRFKSHKALNHIIACLSQISALASGDLSFPNNNLEVKIENTKVVVSDLSTQFGGDLKAQMASITLFSIVKLAASEIGEGAYTLVAKALTNLYIYGLIPESVISIESVPNAHTFERSKAGKAVGIFSVLSNYLTSSSDTPSEPSDENVDAALGALDCVKSCKLDELVIALAQVPQFSRGVLSVLPQSKDRRFIPAQRYLLKLVNFCSQDAGVRKDAAMKAFEIGHTALALHLAPADYLPQLLKEIPAIDDETQKILLQMEPTLDVSTALSKTENPNDRIYEYVSANASKLDADAAKPLLQLFRKHDSDLNGKGIDALGHLAQKFRTEEIYLDVLAALGSFSACSSLDLREDALHLLQKELLQENPQFSWAEIVNRILVPEVMDVILKPEVWKRDPKGMVQTRQQVASLIGKVFLHLSLSMDQEDSDKDLEAWINVLKSLDRLLSTRRQPVLEESVVEMLKNVMLVFKHTARGSERFYNESETVLKGFLPVVAEILTEPQEPQEPQPQPQPQKPEEPEKPKKDDAETNEESETPVEPENTAGDAKESS